MDEQSKSETKATRRLIVRPNVCADDLVPYMKAMRANYPHHQLNDDTATVWMALWVKLANRVGLERFKQAIQACMLEYAFMPTPAHIADMVPRQPDRGGALDEMTDLRKRAAAGEKFYGMGDLAKALEERRRIAAGFPPEVDVDARRAELKEQAEMLMRTKARGESLCGSAGSMSIRSTQGAPAAQGKACTSKSVSRAPGGRGKPLRAPGRAGAETMGPS